MNKKLSRIFFGATILMYSLVMTISYTSCNSDNSNDKASVTPADTTKIAAKKIKKGNASVTMSSANNKSKTIKDKRGVYSQPEKMPEYPGGESALSLYVQNNLNYPLQALNDNKEGTVKISFIVDEKGNVTDAKIAGNKLGDGLDQEAVNVIKNMPKWKPGTVKGKNVKTRLDLPIAFKVSEES